MNTASSDISHAISLRDTTEAARRFPPALRVAFWGSILLAPLVCIWVFRSEILYRSADLASSSLPVAAVVVLLALLLIRLVVPALGRREVLWIYAVVAGTVGISTMGMVQFLVTTLVAPFWFANAGNRWEEFWAHIPAWVAPRSPDVVKGFFVGQSSFYQPQVWKAWLVPVLVWTGFIGTLLAAQFCLAMVLSVHWAKRERLTFSMLQLPLVLTRERSGRSPLLWAGIALAWWTRALVRSPMPLSEGVGLAYLRWFSFGDFRAHALPTYSEMLTLADTAGGICSRTARGDTLPSFACRACTAR